MQTYYDEKTRVYRGVVSNNITILEDELREAQSEILTVLKNHKFNYEVSEYVLNGLIPKLRESHQYEQITVL